MLDLLRARTRRFDTVFVLGLEEGVAAAARRAARRSSTTTAARELGARLERPDPVSRDRYLFYTACTRATRRLYLVRQAATDEGSPLEASPFWQDAAAVFAPEDVERATRRRALSELTWPIEAAPTERERLRALARLSADPDATRARARARRGERLDAAGSARARRAFEPRDRALRNPAVLEQLGGRTVFGATELERFVDCSSAWLFERVVDPKTIDAEADALLRGKIAHQALYAFYSGLPKELGADRVTPETLEPALALPRALPRRRARLGRAARAARGRGGRAARGPPPRPRALRPRGGRVEARASCRGGSRSASAPTARRPSCSAGSSSATASS